MGLSVHPMPVAAKLWARFLRMTLGCGRGRRTVARFRWRLFSWPRVRNPILADAITSERRQRKYSIVAVQAQLTNLDHS